MDRSPQPPYQIPSYFLSHQMTKQPPTTKNIVKIWILRIQITIPHTNVCICIYLTHPTKHKFTPIAHKSIMWLSTTSDVIILKTIVVDAIRFQHPCQVSIASIN
uniref:Putative ovule protein n=1 Tax=Solanum chacoense TaxID=4108 RepID=A0A0V0GM49_SOLCH